MRWTEQERDEALAVADSHEPNPGGLGYDVDIEVVDQRIGSYHLKTIMCLVHVPLQSVDHVVERIKDVFQNPKPGIGTMLRRAVGALQQAYARIDELEASKKRYSVTLKVERVGCTCCTDTLYIQREDTNDTLNVDEEDCELAFLIIGRHVDFLVEHLLAKIIKSPDEGGDVFDEGEIFVGTPEEIDIFWRVVKLRQEGSIR